VKKNFLERVPCNMCGADETVLLYPSARGSEIELKHGEFRSSGDEPLQDPLVRCGLCGLIYVNPRINSNIVMNEYISSVDETFVSQSIGREKTFKRCLKIMQKAWDRSPGRILDVGTANGSFLRVAKDAGWAVSGCEPNKWMCRWCRENYGIRIDEGTLFDVRYQEKNFDVVTLWDVLEHTPDPMAVLRKCARLLRPGGLLVVNYPDIGSWIAHLMGRRWVFLLSVHYFYFTRKTIRLALTKAGFRVVRIKPHFQTLELDYILFRAIPYVGLAGKAVRSLVRFTGLEKIQIPYWMGQTLVIARSPMQ